MLAFDYGILPDAFGGFVRDVAERAQCPPDFTATAIMVYVGAVVGKKIGIRPKLQDDWLVVPNLWGGVVGRPSVMKSHAIRQPLKFLQHLEIEAKKNFASEHAEYMTKRLIADDRWPDTEAKAKAWAVFQAMDTLNPSVIGAECYDGEIPFLRFENEAQCNSIRGGQIWKRAFGPVRNIQHSRRTWRSTGPSSRAWRYSFTWPMVGSVP